MKKYAKHDEAMKLKPGSNTSKLTTVDLPEEFSDIVITA
jgi:hypothetical protein